MHWIRCRECGGRLRKIGFVPPETVECAACGDVFRLTDRNIVKCRNATRSARNDNPSNSEDRAPRKYRPSWKKLKGER